MTQGCLLQKVVRQSCAPLLLLWHRTAEVAWLLKCPSRRQVLRRAPQRSGRDPLVQHCRPPPFGASPASRHHVPFIFWLQRSEAWSCNGQRAVLLPSQVKSLVSDATWPSCTAPSTAGGPLGSVSLVAHAALQCLLPKHCRQAGQGEGRLLHTSISGGQAVQILSDCSLLGKSAFLHQEKEYFV